ncbi:DUF1433 domain-containing protein [Virgibacillus dokdonensis]|uniref:DUF1433 domain-containing protein n=1 Tax=Virgibacillus dokdonensis TaxID=302167 RepID=A0A2K9IX64_9BACI|nr:DUF1433 domain-containing protein [Virgibacillus dokdonensis]AUJ24358.1 hypothetical protein A21D_01259 [Virgibacillus dokdonensis]
MNSDKENLDENTIQKAKNTAESYLKNNYKNIDKIEFSDDYSSLMEGFMIRGIVNNNNEANFSIDMDVNNNFEIGSVGTGEKFPDKKEEVRLKIVTIKIAKQ